MFFGAKNGRVEEKDGTISSQNWKKNIESTVSQRFDRLTSSSNSFWVRRCDMGDGGWSGTSHTHTHQKVALRTVWLRGVTQTFLPSFSPFVQGRLPANQLPSRTDEPHRVLGKGEGGRGAVGGAERPRRGAEAVKETSSLAANWAKGVPAFSDAALMRGSCYLALPTSLTFFCWFVPHEGRWGLKKKTKKQNTKQSRAEWSSTLGLHELHHFKERLCRYILLRISPTSC